MNNSEKLDLFDPFITTEQAAPKSFFYRLGERFGRSFCAVKKKVTNKYFEVTQGINQKLDEEYEYLRAEFEADLLAQVKEQRNRWIVISVIASFIGFFVGMLTAFNL